MLNTRNNKITKKRDLNLNAQIFPLVHSGNSCVNFDYSLQRFDFDGSDGCGARWCAVQYRATVSQKDVAYIFRVNILIWGRGVPHICWYFLPD
jgi:hypothetical protein